MKKLFTITSVLALGLLITLACKKSSTSSTPSSTSSTTGSTTTSTASATPSAPSNTTTTNFSINDTATAIPTSNGISYGTTYLVLALDNTGNDVVELTFSGATTPASGTYSITSTNPPPANHCNFEMTISNSTVAIATSGVVTVVSATSPSNTAYFVDVLPKSGSTTYTLTGAIRY